MTSSSSPDTDLSDLRAKIRQLDKLLIQMAAHRIEICLRIGERKHERGLQVRDPQVERRLMREVRAFAAEWSLDPDVAESFIRVLVEYSVDRQLQQRAIFAGTPGASGARWP